MSLSAYHQKRKFDKTPEPAGKELKTSGPLRFVVQKHEASRLHYDFRLELDGVLKSWAVPKGPSLNPEDKRLAMEVEDHPMEYENFEGIIPKGNYGAGTVMVWDKGVYSPLDTVERKKAEKILRDQLKKGHLTFVLLGEKVKGEFALIKTPHAEEKAWLLIKKGDEYATRKNILTKDHSVLTGRTMEEIEKKAPTERNIWLGKPKDVDLSGAKKGRLEHAVKPMLATSIEEPFDNPDWIFELKWDGYRAIAEISDRKAKLYSRNHQSFNEKYAPIVTSLEKIPGNMVLDGEIVVVDKKGRPDFQLMQDYPSSGGELIYYVFDILYYEGRNLKTLPLIKRKEIVKEVLPDLPYLRYGDYISTHGKAFFKEAHKLQLEGIMAKKADSEYFEGSRSKDWLKIKISLRQEAVIAGFTEPKGNRQHFGALVLGLYRHGKLEYIGHTGGGFNDKSLEATIKKLKKITRKESPFAVVPKTNAPVTWVKPELICEVTFHEWTKDHIMRQPIFLGLRDDKAASEVEDEVSAKKEAKHEKIGKQTVTLTNLSKVFWPKEGYTKGDLIEYYSEMSKVLLPYLIDRPESLLRYPDGITGQGFYQKNVSNLTADWLKTIKIHSNSGDKTVEYLLCQDKETLLYIINLGCIDLHPWASRKGSLSHPDFIILDLDPEKVSFEKVIEVALTTRQILEDLDIKSYIKTSGSRGLHIYIPMGAKYDYDQARNFSLLLGMQVQEKLPDLVSLKRNPKDRQGMVYIDYLRNIKSQTAASAYSVRPKPGATVSTPLRWEEVNTKLDPSVFTIKTMRKRLDKHGDLFKGVMGKGVDMKKVLKKLEGM
jgi:bifunctional non-homologous end joining protein LigD